MVTIRPERKQGRRGTGKLMSDMISTDEVNQELSRDSHGVPWNMRGLDSIEDSIAALRAQNAALVEALEELLDQAGGPCDLCSPDFKGPENHWACQAAIKARQALELARGS